MSPDYVTTAQDGGKVVSLTYRPPLHPGNAPGTHFRQRLSRGTQCDRKDFISIKNSNDTSWDFFLNMTMVQQHIIVVYIMSVRVRLRCDADNGNKVRNKIISLLQLTIVAPSGSISGLGPASIETDRQHLHQLRMVHDWDRTRDLPICSTVP